MLSFTFSDFCELSEKGDIYIYMYKFLPSKFMHMYINQ